MFMTILNEYLQFILKWSHLRAAPLTIAYEYVSEQSIPRNYATRLR